MRTDRRSTGRGRGICIGIIDSGVHAAHPHVKGVAGGIGLDARGQVSGDYVDRIGHGTAVTAAIREKAPAADCYAIRIFDARLAASSSTLLSAIEWAVAARVHVINLSLGSTNRAHEPAFASAVARARAAGVAIVAARDEEGVEWLPGCLPGVVQVQADWDCPREELRVGRVGDEVVFRASGFARPVPGVDPRRNLHGISFAVANVSGFLACALSDRPAERRDPIACLEQWARSRQRREKRPTDASMQAICRM
jgi:subtilisin family serine protease